MNPPLLRSRVGAPTTPKQEGTPGVQIDPARDEWVGADGTGQERKPLSDIAP